MTVDSELIYIDSILFFIGIHLAIWIVCTRFNGSLRHILIGYAIITFSACNIFIKPVGSYLIVIPRTFIFYYKIIGNFSPYDIFLVISILLIFIKNIYIAAREKSIHRISVHKDILYLTFYRDIVLFFLGILGSVVFIALGGSVEWGVEIRYIRGFLTGILVMYFFSSIIIQLDSLEKSRKLISTLSLLTLINMASEFISSFFLQEISWERGGHKVVFFDQTSGILSIIYFPIIFYWSSFFDKTTKATSIFTVFLILYNHIKITYLYLGLVAITVVCFGVKNKIPSRIYFMFFVTIFSCFLYTIFFLNNSSEIAKNTRVGQMESYFKTIENQPLLYMTGIGRGGLFERQQMTEDGGEIREFEKDVYINKQWAFQVPFISHLKETGILGILFVFWIFVISLCKSEKLFSSNPYSGTVALFVTFFSFLGKSLISLDPQFAFYLVTAYLYLHIGYNCIEVNKNDCS
jgi:hypothetical protein